MSGKFVNEWNGVLAGSGKDIKEVDVAMGVSTLLAVKDADELVRVVPAFLDSSARTDYRFSVLRAAAAKRAQRGRHDQ